MPERKSKAFYIDTNIALDYATNRDIQTVLVLEKIKERGWKCVSSTFLAMEMADYKKDSIFIEKAIGRKWEVRRILRNVQNEKGLKGVELKTALEWFEDFQRNFSKLEMYDFLQDSDGWNLAQDISFNSNLSAPDSIHLASAMLGALAGLCNIFITKDKLLNTEAKRIISEVGIKSRLKVMDISEVKKTYFKTRYS